MRDVLASPGRPLPEAVRAEMEAGFGADFSGVRIHTGPVAARSAAAVAARAYTSGSHIVLGRYADDRHVLAHELAHVLQQRRGPVDGGEHPGGLRLSDPGDRFERAAEASARRLLSGPARRADDSAAGAGPNDAGATGGSPAGSAGAVVQRWQQGTMYGDKPIFTKDEGRAGTVEVHNLHGAPLAASENQPSREPIGWSQLQSAGLVKGGDKPQPEPYNAVRMHLWNGRLGGPGNDTRNLAPGPGNINSLMSTRAETPAKALVESDEWIWLRTAVRYQTDTVNASDFTSVVPISITMKWGVENDPQTHRSWQTEIPLPVDPLGEQEAAAFKDWGTAHGDDAKLIARLQGETEQVRAQVLGLVPRALVPAMLLQWPAMFGDMAPSLRARLVTDIFTANSSLVAANFLRDLDLHADDVPELVVYPLSSMNQHDLAAELFLLLVTDEADRERVVIRERTRFTDILGDRIDEAAMTNCRVFGLFNEDEQTRLLETMVALGRLYEFLQRLATAKEGAKLLDQLALLHGGTTAKQRVEFVGGIQEHVPEKVLQAHRQLSKNRGAGESTKRITRSRSVGDPGATKRIDKQKGRAAIAKRKNKRKQQVTTAKSKKKGKKRGTK